MSLKVVPFKRLGVVSYSPSIATMAISCIVCEIWRLIVENRAIFIPHLYFAPPSEFREDLGTHKTRMNGLSCGGRRGAFERETRVR